MKVTEFAKMEPPQKLRGAELERVNAVTNRIIGAAIEVHRILGPGLLEALYDTALCIEFDERRYSYARQVRVPAIYKGCSLGHYVVDFVVDDLVVVEIKSVSTVLPIYQAQLLTYLRLMARPVGLLINFNSRLMKEGIRRVVL